MIKRLLCVDDDKLTLILSDVVIKKALFTQQTITTTDGEKALAHFAEIAGKGEPYFNEAPELIFLDLNMPVMNGWEFLEAYTNRYAAVFPATKIIIVSSSIDPVDKLKAKDYPFVIDFISKPLTVDILNKIKINYFKDCFN